MSEKNDKWWEEWKKPDGTPCTKHEMLRALAAIRIRNKRTMKCFTVSGWLGDDV